MENLINDDLVREMKNEYARNWRKQNSEKSKLIQKNFYKRLLNKKLEEENKRNEIK